MAGIKVPQYNVYKIGTTKLKYHNWNLENYTVKEARHCNELVALFEGEEFRLIAKIRNRPIREINFLEEILMVVIDSPGDFSKAVRKKGITINGITYKRFLGTAGGLKNNTILFVNQNIIEELSRRCRCDRKDIPIVPAKLEAYQALTCSASQPICEPNGILVVSDALVNIVADIIYIDDSDPDAKEPQMEPKRGETLENNATDGFNLCTIEYMRRVAESLDIDYVPSGVCLRNAWLKGMLYPFPIREFAEEMNNGEFIVNDIWGNPKDLRNIEMILTESSLKLWKAYDSIEDYVSSYRKNGYGFAVTKIAPHVLDEQRLLNYQYLQSYDFTDEDIVELCKPTVDFLKAACCGDYKATKRFIGIAGSVEHNTWQEALTKSEYMLGDPFIISAVHKMIERKIDDAKIGKLIVNGNYQIVSGDPFILMQHVCGLVETGLLKKGEIYSRYWVDKEVPEVVTFRSPMTSHNNIVKHKIACNETARKWYRYTPTVLIVNSFDTTCQAENGMDYDGDLAFTTNNKVLLDRHVQMPAIICIQRNVDKIIPLEEDMIKMEKNAMGNKVGTITNRVTAMMEVQSRFEKGSPEYEVLSKRIACGQLYQQNEIDKIKGIVAKPMPTYWYNRRACEDDFQKSICVDKKPYFMTYVYDDYKKKYKSYMDNSDASSRILFNLPLTKLLEIDNPTEEQCQFVECFHRRQPFGMGKCAMNKICWHIEREFENYEIRLKQQSSFDHTIFQSSCEYSEEKAVEVISLGKEYLHQRRKVKTDLSLSPEERTRLYRLISKEYKDSLENICPEPEERLNLMLDLYYKQRIPGQMFWDCCGGLYIKKIGDTTNAYS